MKTKDIKVGIHVRIGKLNPTTGMFVKRRHLDCRKEGTQGTVMGYVPGHGGDVWWVEHDGCDDVGAYSVLEMKLP